MVKVECEVNGCVGSRGGQFQSLLVKSSAIMVNEIYQEMIPALLAHFRY